MTDRQNRSLRRWVPAAVVVAVLVSASVVDAGGGTGTTIGPFGLDKVLHALGYAALAAAVSYALARRGPTVATLAGVLLAVAGLGVAVELVQLTLPFRRGDPADALANALGAALALACWWALAVLRGGDRHGRSTGSDGGSREEK